MSLSDKTTPASTHQKTYICMHAHRSKCFTNALSFLVNQALWSGKWKDIKVFPYVQNTK